VIATGVGAIAGVAARGAADGATLAGDLGRFVATDVLQFLKLSGATGRCEFERAGERVTVAFAHGRPLWARTTGRSVRLGEALVHHGGADASAVDAALAEQRRRPDRPLGALLRERGVRDEDVAQALAEVFRRIVCLLSLWPDGRFRFVPGEPGTDDGAALDLELERVLLEGLHQADLAFGPA
jgi:hypothetical protein